MPHLILFVGYDTTSYFLVKWCHKPPIFWWFIPLMVNVGMVYYCFTGIVCLDVLKEPPKTYKIIPKRIPKVIDFPLGKYQQDEVYRNPKWLVSASGFWHRVYHLTKILQVPWFQTSICTVKSPCLMLQNQACQFSESNFQRFWRLKPRFTYNFRFYMVKSSQSFFIGEPLKFSLVSVVSPVTKHPPWARTTRPSSNKVPISVLNFWRSAAERTAVTFRGP